MGLADLKKNSTPFSQSGQCAQAINESIDEFIDDFIEGANLYAMGVATSNTKVLALSAHGAEGLHPKAPRQRLNNNHNSNNNNKKNSNTMVLAARAASQRLDAVKKTSQFRKATFSLTEQAIAHLADMASDCDIAKSRLLRILIENHYLLSADERRRLENLIPVE